MVNPQYDTNFANASIYTKAKTIDALIEVLHQNDLLTRLIIFVFKCYLNIEINVLQYRWHPLLHFI